MSRDQGRYLLVVVLLAVAAVGALFITQRSQLGAQKSGEFAFVADIDNWQRTEREQAVITPYDFSLESSLDEIPLQLGDWEGKDIPQTNLEVFILLEPEQYVQRRYILPDGRYIWLSLIGSRQSKSFHSPQICYDTDGWTTDASSEPIPLEEGELFALRLMAEKAFTATATVEHVILYFYLWPSYERNPQDGTVLVKVTSPLYDTLEETLALEKDFFSELFTSVAQ